MIAARPFAPGALPIQVTKNILLAGVIGVCLGAPLLLPFLELAANAESYKFHEYQIQTDPIQTLLSGLATPVNKGGSAFLGVVSPLMAVFALIFGNRKNRWLAILALTLGLWCSLPGPLAHLSKIPAFSLISLMAVMVLQPGFQPKIFSCAMCHTTNATMAIRGEILQRRFKLIIIANSAQANPLPCQPTS